MSVRQSKSNLVCQQLDSHNCDVRSYAKVKQWQEFVHSGVTVSAKTKWFGLQGPSQDIYFINIKLLNLCRAKHVTLIPSYFYCNYWRVRTMEGQLRRPAQSVREESGDSPLGR